MSLLPNLGSIGSGVSNFYNGEVTNSLRVNAGHTLTRAFGASPTSATTMSFGGWVKFSAQHYQNFFSSTLGGSGVAQAFMRLNGDLKLEVDSYDGSAYFFNYRTTRVFRDTSAWYHIWVQIDTTDGTDSNRVKIYVNGVRETAFDATTHVSSGSSSVVGWNTNTTHYFGYNNGSYGLGGYIADWYFLDGQDVSPIDTVGEFKNGIFIPKEYSATFGNKGFHLKFIGTGTSTSSGSVANPTNIGDDSSGQNNHWAVTSSGILSHDANLSDSPENNFSTWNALFKGGEQSSSIAATSTLSEGNLQVSVPTNSYMGNTFRPVSGKWYCEFRLKTLGDARGEIDWGWLQATTYAGTSGHAGQANKWGAYYHAYSTAHIKVYDETSQLGSDINLTISAGDVLQLAWDIDNNKGWIGINDTYYAADNGTDGNPSAGTNQTFTFTADEAQNLQCYVANGLSTDVFVANFGQDSTFGGDETATTNADAKGKGAFHHAPPTGFLACCSANLEEPTIGPNSDTTSSQNFAPVIYNGLNSTAQDITVGFKPDFVWIKTRNAAISHMLFDSNRGATKFIQADATGAEGTGSDSLTDFDVSGGGFSLGADSSTTAVNNNGKTYVSFNWKANGSTTTTNDASSTGVGDIDSVYQANTTAGFSIVTYTSNNSNSTTVAHGLGIKPDIMFQKNRSATSNWLVLHQLADGTLDYHLLDSTSAGGAGSQPVATTSTIATWKSSGSDTTGNLMVAYVFASIEGYSKHSSYTGNGDADGTFVFTGFRPAWVMTKSIGSGNWYINDSGRYPSNITGGHLYADLSNAESGSGIDILSNGFKPRNTDASQNASGTKYIYMAFAEAPFKYANAR